MLIVFNYIYNLKSYLNKTKAMEENNTYLPEYQKIPVPYSTAVLVLGILFIVGCSVFGFIGLVMGIIALVLAGKGKRMFNENPRMYSISSFNNLKAGQICAIIGTILSGIYLFYIIIMLLIVGSAMMGMLLTLPWDQMSTGGAVF